ncbi:MAG TPA: hypothetical protein VG389_20325 [Myxococcota bacterium]|jgi:hypothetical protein|nr:hypothetical protein [Myxococcota bacterium]
MDPRPLIPLRCGFIFAAAALFASASTAGCRCGSATESDAGDAQPGGDGGPDASADAGASDAAACPIYTDLCGGACIPTSVDPVNCGDCDVTCTGALACSAGACSATCLSGQTACDNSCVDILTSNAHCGGCDAPCDPGDGCGDGTCVPALITAAPPAMCAEGGPPIVVGGTETSCIAVTSFTWALCSCTDVQLSAPLLTDAYDSSMGPYTPPGGLGAGVGLNELFMTSSTADVSGALWASSTAGIGTSNDLTVRQELHSGGDFTLSAPGIVGADAFVNGDVSTPMTLDIAGDLHVPAGAAVSAGVTYASLVTGPVTVPPPCDCDPADLVDIAGIVAAHTTMNDNALIGLDPTATTNPMSAVRIDLPCGHYYLDAVTGSRDVTIVAHGNTALYVGGDVQLSQSFRVTVDPGFSLDVFIAGDLSVSSGSSFGSPNYPAMTRVYIGGANGFSMSAGSLFGAFFYAAYGPVMTSGDIEVFGGVFAGDFGASAGTTIHYDLAVLDLPGDCTNPGGCDSCADCGNQACIAGACGACTDSSQCCAPLLCVSGVCMAYIP